MVVDLVQLLVLSRTCSIHPPTVQLGPGVWRRDRLQLIQLAGHSRMTSRNFGRVVAFSTTVVHNEGRLRTYVRLVGVEEHGGD